MEGVVRQRGSEHLASTSHHRSCPCRDYSKTLNISSDYQRDKKEPVFHGESVESLVDLKMLYEAVNVLPSEELTPEDQVNISLLGRAIKRKSEGKPYAEVRPKDSLF